VWGVLGGRSPPKTPHFPLLFEKILKTIDLEQVTGDKIMFKINEANWDRIARVVLGIVLLALGLSGVVGSVLGIVFDILGVVFLLTGVVGVCPLYMLFKFSTKKS
jgi:hypothetical protein